MKSHLNRKQTQIHLELFHLFPFYSVLIQRCLYCNITVIGIRQLQIKWIVINALVMFIAKIHHSKSLVPLSANQTIHQSLAKIKRHKQ